MKTKILIAVLSIGLFSVSTVKAQETKQVQVKHEQMGVTYSCPMHADVKSDKPGTCPKCGMELKKMEMETSAMPQCCAGKDHSKMEMKCDSTKTTMNHSEMTHDQMGKASYTCPMHADIKSDKPGACAKCGMEMKMEAGKTPACCAGKDHSKMEMKMETTKMAKATYACPMKCEGEKTYDKAGSCPKCNMDLKKMEIKKEK